MPTFHSADRGITLAAPSHALPSEASSAKLSMYSPSGSGNVHTDTVMKKVSVAFPRGTSKTTKGRKSTRRRKKPNGK